MALARCGTDLQVGLCSGSIAMRVRLDGVEQAFGAVAQLGERLPCTQEVRSSILLGSTNSPFLTTDSWVFLRAGLTAERATLREWPEDCGWFIQGPLSS